MKESNPLDQLASNLSHAAVGAIKAGKAAGMAVGAAAGGPFGVVVSALLSSKKVWTAILSVILAFILIISIITNLFGIILSQFGMADAGGYVQSARNQEVEDIQSHIQVLMEEEPAVFEEIFQMLDKKQEGMLAEMQADYEAAYGSLEKYEMKLVDEYEDALKPEFAKYLAVLFAVNWNGSQTRSFLDTGTVDIYETELSSPYDSYFAQAQEIYGVPEALMKAIAKVESDFDPYATSAKGAKGIMQLMPKTAKSLGVLDPYDPKENIMGGAKYLADSLAIFSGYDNGVELTVASYHAGVGAVKKAGYKIPQNGQTPAYVEKVMGYIKQTESGSLTPGRKAPEAAVKISLRMLENEVYSRQDQFFDWTKGEPEEEEKEVTHYYFGEGSERQEISKADYEAYQSAGASHILQETETEIWQVVPYRIVNLLEGSLREMEEGYHYKLVTTPKRFLIALDMLKYLSGDVEWPDFIMKFGWKELVFGQGPTDISYDTDTVTEGEAIAYDTQEGCVQEVVYFNQTEEPWASVPLCGSTIRASGCGPTSMAMVISTLSGQTVTPAQVAAFTEQHDLYVPGKGTSHALPKKAAQNWGLAVERMQDTHMDEVAEKLQSGAMAVVICGEYTITGSGSGHYIVLTGVTQEGFFTIADPASRVRSGRVYSADTIAYYARDLGAGSIWMIGG